MNRKDLVRRADRPDEPPAQERIGPRAAVAGSARRVAGFLLVMFVLAVAFGSAALFQPIVASRVAGIAFRAADMATPNVAANRLAHAGPRPYLGITYVPLNPHVARSYGLENDWGVLITGVANGSPASKGGLLPGDVLLFVGDQPLTPDISLLDILWRQQPDEPVSLLFWREGRRFAIPVALELR